MDLKAARLIVLNQYNRISPKELVQWAQEFIEKQTTSTDEILNLASVSDILPNGFEVDDLFRKAISSLGLSADPSASVTNYAELLAKGILDQSVDFRYGCKELKSLYKLTYADFLSPWITLDEDLYLATENITGNLPQMKFEIMKAAQKIISQK